MNGLYDKAGIQIHENDTAKGVDDECELLEEPNDLIVGLAHDDAQREESHVSGAKMASFKLSPRDAPINLSCSRGKLQFSRHLQRHWTKSDRKIMYGELFRPVLRV
ncbi:hypothetical protein, partial [Pseudomonas sp. WS 5071]|uniref:hypothetical protein n=1 Tax=Pseudomonas sp. WS 5071 TaxID=2717479 RepID=UPI0014743CD2